MTVGELIERLRKYPADMPVVTPGFDESNYDDVGIPVVDSVVFCPDAPRGHLGQHIAESDDPEKRKGVLAVVLNFDV